jgi:hypothetical protein
MPGNSCMFVSGNVKSTTFQLTSWSWHSVPHPRLHVSWFSLTNGSEGQRVRGSKAQSGPTNVQWASTEALYQSSIVQTRSNYKFVTYLVFLLLLFLIFDELQYVITHVNFCTNNQQRQVSLKAKKNRAAKQTIVISTQ